MNEYESGAQKNIPAVLLYVTAKFRDGTERLLMIHRNAKDRPGDFHVGKWNGLGGKCDVGESFAETAARELFEESSLKVSAGVFSFAGMLQFPNFKPQKNEDWSCAVFRAEVSEAEALAIPAEVAEGALHWIDSIKLLELNLWAGDREFIPHVLARRPFTGCIWYSEGKVERLELNLIPSAQN